VADGVDVISMSLGTDFPGDYLTDPIAIGALHAVQEEVTVVASAGNSGPGPNTVTNQAPSMFTVGASTMDREFPEYITFGGSTINVRRM
jgi:subtilisin family serine protease